MTVDFYGADDHAMFALERAAMDRPGHVLAALDRRLPASGTVLDVGAGDGFAAGRLSTADRAIVPLEPAAGMRVQGDDPLFVGGNAQQLPFADRTFDAAYSTWAYFFTTPDWDPTPGLAELRRVVRPGGPLLIVDNIGDDELTALTDRDIVADIDRWAGFGFACEVVDTVFAFASPADATTLLEWYFGPLDPPPPTTLTYRVGLFHTTV